MERGQKSVAVLVLLLMVFSAIAAGLVYPFVTTSLTKKSSGTPSLANSNAPLSQAAMFALALHGSEAGDGGIPRDVAGLTGAIRNGVPVAMTSEGVSLSGSSSASPVRPKAVVRSDPPTAPKGGVRFINDTSFIAQGETSVGALKFGKVTPSVGIFTGKLATKVAVFGSFNDFRAFFCPGAPNPRPFDITCQRPYTGSITGWTFSGDGGGHVAKGGLVPGVYTTNTVVDEIGRAHV